MKNKEQQQAESLNRAKNGLSFSNFPHIYAGFLEKGLAEEDIKPRVNIFTFNAWKALGRSVKKGEHGVKIVSMVTVNKGEGDSKTYPRSTTVFHISQTEEITEEKFKTNFSKYSKKAVQTY